MAEKVDLNGVKTFDPHGDPSQIGESWKRWKRSFEFFVVGKGVTDAGQKKALLLHCAGDDVQDIFFTLPVEGGEDDDYVKTVRALDKHFLPKVNIPYERYTFRLMKQEDTETVDQFMIRLRQKSVVCGFDKPDEQIRDQIIEKCRSHKIRTKLLEKGHALTLDQLRTIASTTEITETQAKSMESSLSGGSVNRIVNKPKFKAPSLPTTTSSKGKCFRCGQDGHFAKDRDCPAKGKNCNKCGLIGHYASCCKTKGEKKKYAKQGYQSNYPKQNFVRHLEQDEEDEYAFSVGLDKDAEQIKVLIGDNPVEMIIDSGASVNIIDMCLWNQLKSNKIKCQSEKTSKKLFPYGSEKPLDLAGKFVTSIAMITNGNSVEAEFFVLKGKGQALLGKKTASELGVLTLGGHMMSKNGFEPTEERVKAVADAKPPTSSSEVRSFLGLVNFSARYIPNLASLSEPLRQLTKKNATFRWGKAEQDSFQSLKDSLSNVKTLGYFSLDAEKTTLVTDASNVGLGAVLIQQHKGETKVISYASRSLSEVEQRYSTTEKEALGVVWACERFNVYLYGIDFELMTDHKPLEGLYGLKSRPCARIERWMLKLLPYRYTIRYPPGKTNVADALSRLVEKGSNVNKFKNARLQSQTEMFVNFIVREATPIALSLEEVELASESDQELQNVRQCILSGNWDKTLVHYFPMQNELCTLGHLVLRGNRLVIPQKLRRNCVELAHQGHLGIVGTKQHLRSKVWWPGLDKDVEKYVKSCHGCQLVSAFPNPEPLQPTTMPTGPWQDLAIDLLGPLDSGHYVFVVVDYYSRYYEIEIFKDTTSERIIEALENMFSRHGYAESVTSDNGPQFVSSCFESYLRNCGIEHRRVTPLHPAANGEVERQNRSLMKRIRIAHSQSKDWKKEIRTYLLAYRSTPHSTTGVSPAELMFGRKLRTKLPQIEQPNRMRDEEVRDRDGYAKQRNKLYIDTRRNAQPSDIEEGDTVLVKRNIKRSKMDTPFVNSPMKLVKKCGNSCTVETSDGVQYKRNSTHVKRYVDSMASSEVSQKDNDNINSENIPDCHQELEETRETNGVPISNQRPVREKRMPQKFDDYVVG